MMITSLMSKMNYLRLYFLSFLFISTFAVSMQQPVTVAQQNAFDVLPDELVGYTLGFLYQPHKNPGTTYIVRFLRAAKKYYFSQQLTSYLMNQMRINNPIHLGSDAGGNNWLQSAFDLGTPSATSILKSHLVNKPDELYAAHIHYAYMLNENSRIASILKQVGADLNTPVNENGETAFLVVAKESLIVEYLKKMLAAGAEINTIDKQGDNVLMAIIRSAGEEKRLLPCVEFLLAQGVNILQQTPNGETAYGLARWLQYLKVAEKIKNAQAIAS